MTDMVTRSTQESMKNMKNKKNKGFTLIELLIVVAIIGIIAAIAIPSLLRARVSANEAGVQGDTRSVGTSSLNYETASMNNGYPPAASCMAVPSNDACIPDYPSTAPTFLDPNLGQDVMTKGGYVRSYTVTDVSVGTGKSGFCSHGQPLTFNRTGTRSFGTDSSGVLAGTLGDVVCCDAGILDSDACPAMN